MSLHGHTVLIVESEAGPFAARLQAAVEATGAECLLARSPAVAVEHGEQPKFSAALVNVEWRDAVERLGVPSLLYVKSEPPKGIAASLERMLEH